MVGFDKRMSPTKTTKKRQSSDGQTYPLSRSLQTNVTKFNEAINECKRKGQRWLHKKLPIPGWTNVGLIFTHGGGVARSFDLINRWDGKCFCVCIYLILCLILC